jgi:hypothetical protein
LPSRTIYPSIPDPGNTLATIVPCLLAIKQTLQMIIINAQSPNPNYTPSSAAQIFVTRDDLQGGGVVGEQGPAGPQGPPGEGIVEAPVDVNTYGRHDLAWTKVFPLDCSQNLQPAPGNQFTIQVMGGTYAGVVAKDATYQGWALALGTIDTPARQQFAILNPSGQPVLWIDSSGVVHVNAPIVVGP